MALIDVGDTWQQDLDTAERLHKTILCQVRFVDWFFIRIRMNSISYSDGSPA